MAEDPTITEPEVTDPQPPAGGNPEPKNVDQKELREKLNQLDDLGKKMDKLFEQFNKPDGTQPDSDQPSELEVVKQQLAKQQRKESLGLARSIAKESNLEIDGLERFFVGDNDDATKANVKSFVDYMQAHDEALKKSLTKSTDTGFNTTRSNKIGNPQDFLGSMLDEQFGSQK